MIRLGPTEKRCIEFLRNYLAEHGRAPAQREIAAGVARSHRRVGDVIISLERKGYLRRPGKGHRRIELIGAQRSVPINPEILILLRQYAKAEKIGVATAANELLRGALGAA